MKPRLVPELNVDSLERSLVFYTSVLGFSVMYCRPEDKFAYLNLEGAHIMLEEASAPGRHFVIAPLEKPYGRGVNFQIEVSNVDALLGRVRAAGFSLVIPLEESWYRDGAVLHGNRQFVVADPDGYLLRFFTDIGDRAASGD
jgi:catechol 2,3-dioxygenase-like lactoylglutathione lyase family enzyme